jgi:predicted ATPase
LLACVRIFAQLYADEELRAACAERVRNGYPKLPVMLRLELLAQLAEAALDHGDAATARRFALDVQRRGDGVEWAAEQHAPHLARTGRLLARCGEGDAARREIQAAESAFEAGRERIFDIDRCDALLPVFDAWRTLGDAEKAEATLIRAVQEASVNPNARPRAEDLVATLILLARIGHEPSAPVRQALIELREGLVDPW